MLDLGRDAAEIQVVDRNQESSITAIQRRSVAAFVLAAKRRRNTAWGFQPQEQIPSQTIQALLRAQVSAPNAPTPSTTRLKPCDNYSDHVADDATNDHQTVDNAVTSAISS